MKWCAPVMCFAVSFMMNFPCKQLYVKLLSLPIAAGISFNAFPFSQRWFELWDVPTTYVLNRLPWLICYMEECKCTDFRSSATKKIFCFISVLIVKMIPCQAVLLGGTSEVVHWNSLHVGGRLDVVRVCHKIRQTWRTLKRFINRYKKMHRAIAAG